MKKILLSIFAASITLAACNAQSGFKVTGTLEGMQDGKAIIATFENNTVDTLAKSAITNGTFEFTGKVNGITAAYIMIQGQRGGIPIMLENTNFTVNAGQAGLKIEGGEAQKLANQFNDLGTELQQLQQTLYPEFQAAQQAGNKAKVDSIINIVNTANAAAQVKETELIKANADTYVAAYIVASGLQQMELDQIKERFALLGNNAKATTHGKAIAEQIAKQEKVAIGQIAPNFTLTTPSGESLSLYDVKGKVKLIDFWASWCGPCRGENPNVVAIYKEFQPKGLEIIGVSLDQDKAKWEEAIAKDGLTWKHVSDLKAWGSVVVPLYSITGIPHTVLLDENNKIIAKNLRGDELKAKIAELLK